MRALCSCLGNFEQRRLLGDEMPWHRAECQERSRRANRLRWRHRGIDTAIHQVDVRCQAHGYRDGSGARNGHRARSVDRVPDTWRVQHRVDGEINSRRCSAAIDDAHIRGLAGAAAGRLEVERDTTRAFLISVVRNDLARCRKRHIHATRAHAGSGIPRQRAAGTDGHVMRGGTQGDRLEFFRGTIRIELSQQRHHARHVRRGHRSSADVEAGTARDEQPVDSRRGLRAVEMTLDDHSAIARKQHGRGPLSAWREIGAALALVPSGKSRMCAGNKKGRRSALSVKIATNSVRIRLDRDGPARTARVRPSRREARRVRAS